MARVLGDNVVARVLLCYCDAGLNGFLYSAFRGTTYFGTKYYNKKLNVYFRAMVIWQFMVGNFLVELLLFKN